MKKIKLVILTTIISFLVLGPNFTGHAADPRNDLVSIPIGGIIMWWGDPEKLPIGFELADGGIPNSDSKLFKQLEGTANPNKPNLMGAFPRGAEKGTIAVNDLQSGGADQIAARRTGGTRLTIEQLPNHDHGMVGAANGTPMNFWNQPSGGRPGNYNNYQIPWRNRQEPYTRWSQGGKQPHDHSIPAHDNRPRFQEVFFLIRVN